MWTPTHVIVTVLKARNLLEKGKGGNDAYCMIGMGKEKFLTSVKQKSLSPVWEEQAEFELGERADLKITVYHKSSIIDEFVGRAVINVSELVSHDTNKSYTSWYKLGGKPEKSENNKKPEKQRGDIEVRVEFVIKPKAGSMMDLSLKNKEKSLSIKNLKSSTSNLKQSLGDKFKSLGKRKDSIKYNGENQLAEQARRMGGSKKDFLDGEDAQSIYSSYSSINGPTLQRQNTDTRINSMSRFNPARSSFISKTSSKMGDADSLSKEGDNTRNDDDFLEDAASNDFDRDDNNTSFQRRNSTKFSRTGSTISRRVSARKNSDLKLDQGIVENSAEQAENGDENNGGLHIAPLPPFVNSNSTSTSTPHLQAKNGHNNSNNEQKTPSPKELQKQRSHKHPIIDEEAALGNVASSGSTASKKVNSPSKKEKTNNQIKSPTTTPTAAADSFASIFSASLENTLKSPTNENDEDQQKQYSISSGIASMLGKSNQKDPDTPLVDTTKSPSSSSINGRVLPPIVTVNNVKKAENDDDEEHIDWASSDEEEDLQKEFASFERNQVPTKQVLEDQDDFDTYFSTLQRPNQSQEKLSSNSNTDKKTNTNNNNNNTFGIELFEKVAQKKNEDHFEVDSLTSIEKPEEEEEKFAARKSPTITSTSSHVKNNLEFPQLFPSTNTFSIDIDPFSSSDSTSDAVISNQVGLNPFEDNFLTEPTNKVTKIIANPFADPFDIDDFNSANQNNHDPFSVFNNVVITNNLIKMSSEEDNAELNFKDIDLPENDSLNKTKQDEVNERSIDVDDAETKPSTKKNKYDYDDSSSSDDEEFKMPPQTAPTKRKSVDIVEIRDSFSESTFEEAKTKIKDKIENDSEKEDDMDNAFTNFSNEKVTTTVEDLPSLANEFGGTQLKFNDFDGTESNTDFNDQMSLAMRKGDTHLETVNVGKIKNGIHDEEINENENVEKEDDTKQIPKSTLEEKKEEEENENETTTMASSAKRPDNVTIISKNFNRGVLRQSERRRLMPTEDLTSDLNSEMDFNTNNSSFTSSVRKHQKPKGSELIKSERVNMKIDFNNSMSNNNNNSIEDEIKTPDFDAEYGFQDTKTTKVDGESNGRSNNGLPDLINQKGSSQLSNTNDKARKFLEGLDGVKFNEIKVPDNLKKQLEYFDRDELLQLIAYQKKYLDYKESRIKDLENYIDNLVVKIIETEPLILMNASNVLTKSSTKLI